MSAANAKLQRWLDLLAALLRRTYPIALEELIREVPGYGRPGQKPESRRRTFERDKDELRRLGIPIETCELDDDIAGYRLDRKAFYLPYLQLVGASARPAPRAPYGYRSLPNLTFTPDELETILLAADRVGTTGIASLAADAQSALGKLGHDLDLKAAVPDEPVRRTAAPPTDAAVFTAVSSALRTRKRLTFDYYSIAHDATTTRTGHAYGLFFLGHHWYLAAAAPDDPTVKNYRLSRIRSVQANAAEPGAPDYTIPDDFSLGRHARSREAWELGRSDLTRATIRTTPEIRAVLAANRLGTEDTDDASLRHFDVRRLDAFARWLLQSGGAMSPVAPAALVSLTQGMVQAARARYREYPA